MLVAGKVAYYRVPSLCREQLNERSTKTIRALEERRAIGGWIRRWIDRDRARERDIERYREKAREEKPVQTHTEKGEKASETLGRQREKGKREEREIGTVYGTLLTGRDHPF